MQNKGFAFWPVPIAIGTNLRDLQISVRKIVFYFLQFIDTQLGFSEAKITLLLTSKTFGISDAQIFTSNRSNPF